MIAPNCHAGIEYPTRLTQLERVERQNDLAINVFRLRDQSRVAPFRCSNRLRVSEDRIVNLLQLTDVGDKSHYVLINDLRRLVGRRVGGHHMIYLCHRCLYSCHSERLWNTHRKLCGSQATQEISLPTPNCPRQSDKLSYLSADDLHSSRVRECECRLPFAIFSDIECLLEEPSTGESGGDIADDVNVLQKHRPIAAAFVVSR